MRSYSSNRTATKLVSHLLTVLAEDEEEDDEISQSIKKKLAYMRKASIIFGEIRQKKQTELVTVEAGAVSGAFDSVAASDAKNERRPLVRKQPRRNKMGRTTSGHF